MSVRTALPGTESTGQVWTVSYIDSGPGGWIGDVQATTNQASITNTTPINLTSLTFTLTVNTSRRIRLSAKTMWTCTAGTNMTGTVSIAEGSTQLTQANFTIGGSGLWAAPDCWVTLAPSAGSHTYKLTANTDGAGSTMTLAAASNYPAIFQVEDVGPA